MQFSCEEESPIGNDPMVVDSTQITNEDETQKEQSRTKRQRYKKQKTHNNNDVKVKFKKFIRDRYELSESSMSTEDGISVSNLCQLFSSTTNVHVDHMHATNYLQSLFHPRLRIWGKEPRRVNLKEKTLQTYCLEAIALKHHNQLILHLKDIHTNNSLEKTLTDEVIWTAITNKMITRYELLECGWVVSICKLTTKNVSKAPVEKPVPEITVNTKWHEIKKSRPQEPKTEDFDYDTLLASCKQFFHPRIKSLPCHATKFGSENNNSGGALPFTSKNLLPRIYDMYGSYEYFFRCLLACSETKQWMKAVLEAQEESLQLTMQKAVQNARHMGRIEATEEIQKRFHLVGPTLQEGCRISKAGYLKQKSIVELESYESAYQREIQKDEHIRQPVPSILLKHREFVLTILNDLLLPLVSNGSKITWKTVVKQLSDRVAVRTDADIDLSSWLCSTVNSNSHIKTLYLSQAVCDKSWVEQVQSKGVIHMTPSDWEAIQPSLGEHASFILRQNYNRLMKINLPIRRRKILLFDSIPLTLYSTVDLNSKRVDRQLLGGENIGDPDPAVKMNCSEFIQHIKDGKIYCGKMCRYEVEVKTKHHKTAIKKPTSYRIWDIGKRLIEMLTRMITHKWLKLTETTITLYFTNWWDGATVLASGLLVFQTREKVQEILTKQLDENL